jgi:glyoxylate/hydroxypyruvate reductase
MTVLLAIKGAGDNWGIEAWHKRFADRLPGRHIVLAAQTPLPVRDIRYAAVWKPEAGLLASLPNLEVIFNLGAGVDALLADPTTPRVPIVRIVNTDLTQRMTEYVVMHVLMHHRRQRMLDTAQANRDWMAKEQWAASAVRVGILGLGELGRDAASVLRRIGFQVSGWSRHARDVPDVQCYAGGAQLSDFLAQTDILVALLPLTQDTRGMLNRDLFSRLARDGVLGAPVLINAGRGGLQIERDILACLDDGTLGAATLDVFESEPLAAESPLWLHPRVTVTPHNAADSDPGAITDDVVAQILAHEQGRPLQNVVDRIRGY